MRLDRIVIENFRRFGKVDLELPDGVIGLVGRNGAGKSTFLESIGWCLYGHDAARTGKELIKRRSAAPGDDVRVEVHFRFGEHTYEVTRELVGKSGNHVASVKADGVLLVPPGPASQREATLYVTRLFHMDRDAFFTSLVARQRELSSLSDARPAERKRILLSLLRIDAVDDAISIARDQRRDARNVLQGMRTSMLDLALLRADLDGARAQAAKLEEELVTTEGVVASLTESVEERRGARDASRIRLEAHRKLAQDMVPHQAAIAHALKDAETTKADLAKAREAEQEALRLAPTLTAIVPLRARVDALATAKARHEELQRTKARIAALSNAITALTAETAATQAKLQQARPVTEALAGLAPERVRLETAQDAARDAREAQARLRSQQDELARIRKLLSEAERDVAEAKAGVTTFAARIAEAASVRASLASVAPTRNDLESQLRTVEQAAIKLRAHQDEMRERATELREKAKSLEDLGPESPCPTCTRPLHEHHESIVAELHTELARLAEVQKTDSQAIAEHRSAAREIRERQAKLAEEEAALRARADALTRDEANHQASAAALKSAEARRQAFVTQLEPLSKVAFDSVAYQRALEQEDSAREALRLFTKREAELRAKHTALVRDEETLRSLGERKNAATTDLEAARETAAALEQLPYDAAEHEAALTRLKALEADRDKHARAVAQAERAPVLVQRLAEMEAALASSRTTVARLEAEVKALAFNVPAHEALEVSFTQAEARLHQARERRGALQVECTKHRVELKHATEQLAEQEALIGKAATVERRVRLLERLAGDRDAGLLPEFKDHLIGRIRPLISTHAGRLFRDLTNARYADLELGEDYDLLVHEDGVAFQLSRFSGGESDLANLCLRLAVGQVVAERAGTEGFGFLALDEIFGSQDDVRKGNILRALQGLTGRFRQILLITHIEDVKEAAEHVIRVEALDDGTSRVTLE